MASGCSNPAGLAISSTAANTAVSIAAGGFIGPTTVAIAGSKSLTQSSAGTKIVAGNVTGGAINVILPLSSTVLGADLFIAIGATAPLLGNDINIVTNGTDGSIMFGVASLGAAPAGLGAAKQAITFVGGTCAVGDYIRLKFISTGYIHVEAVSSAVGGITFA